MTLSASQIQADHLDRWAYIYIRQSDPTQVLNHQESTRRQYDLQSRARQLGWPDERIAVIDEDLGHSASDPSHVRAGFERLVTDLFVGRVGAILSLEVSRLSRQDSEGYRLVEVAAMTNTLLIDEQTIYDPSLPDDRLMLGLKVLLSSNEVRLMGMRLWENKLRKAQRGELRINLPVGLVFDHHQGILLDPDERVQAAVRLLFDRFRLSGKISYVVRYFQEHFRVAYETQVVTEKFLMLVARVEVGGKQVHDANIVATMLSQGITHLLTNNVDDFRRYEAFIDVVPLVD